MDSLSHLTQKLLQERARNASQQQQQQQQQQQPPIAPPPPYSESDTDSDSEDDDDEDHSSPMKLTINAANSIQGSNNLVPTSPTPLADATKFSTLLLHAIKQINNAAASDTKRSRGLKVDLTINCGITVIGDRNVVGNVGLKPKQGAFLGPAAAVAGAKRKAEDDKLAEAEPAVKKVATAEE